MTKVTQVCVNEHTLDRVTPDEPGAILMPIQDWIGKRLDQAMEIKAASERDERRGRTRHKRRRSS